MNTTTETLSPETRAAMAADLRERMERDEDFCNEVVQFFGRMLWANVHKDCAADSDCVCRRDPIRTGVHSGRAA